MRPLLILAAAAYLTKRIAIPLARAFYLTAAIVFWHVPVALIRLAAGVHVRRADPPPPFRGTHPVTGVPLRSFADSLQDLQP